MATATSSVGGLVSGMDTANIIEQYMKIERKPITNLENRKLEYQTQLEAYRGVNSLLLDFSSKVSTLSSDSIWNLKSATSSNQTVLGISVSDSAQIGSYSFRVGRLAQTAQFTSGSFSDRDTSPVSPAAGGVIRVDSSKSLLNRGTDLSMLNGGQGVYRGSIKITDRSGNSAIVDLAAAETLEDVISAINQADGVDVTASLNSDATMPNPSVTGNALVITDSSGGAGTLRITNYGSSQTATDLGIEKSVAAASFTGDSILSIGSATPLSSLRDGLGVNNGTAGTIQIFDDSLSAVMASTIFGETRLDYLNNGAGVNGGEPSKMTVIDQSTDGGTAFEVHLTGAETMQDVVDEINSAIANADENSTLSAELDPTGQFIQFNNADQMTISCADNTASDLGIAFGAPQTGTVSGGVLTPLRYDPMPGYTPLDQLNAGAGVALGPIEITADEINGGVAFQVDLTGAVTVDDVIEKVNNAILEQDPDSSARLSISSSGFGFTFSADSGNVAIAEVGAGTTAADLGILGSDVGGMFVGADVGSGQLGLEVDLSKASSVQAVLDTINAAISSVNPASTLRAQVSSDGRGITFKNGQSLTVTNAGSTTNTTAEDLGIEFSGVTGDAVGNSLIADLNSVQIASISGVNGSGLNGARGDYSQTLGTIRVNDGGTDYDFDLSYLDGADSMSDVVFALNTMVESNFGAGALVFSLNGVGNGIQVKNNTGSDLTFSDLAGTTSADLGLSGVVSDGDSVNGGDLDLNYMSRATKLDDLNSGNGIYRGSFRITDATGSTTDISVSSAKTLGDVIDLINGTSLSVTARINDTGDGIMITESPADASATGDITVEELSGGTTAKDLGLLGAGTGGETGTSVLDGSFETVVSIDTGDTLTDVMMKIADANSRLQTSIINDGSEFAPYRLVVSGRDSGEVGDFAIDTDISQFNFAQTSKGQDAMLLYGNAQGTVSPTVLTSSTNVNTSAVLGLTLNLNQVSSEFVSISVTENRDEAMTAVQELVDSYNGIYEFIDALDDYDAEKGEVGIFFANSETRNLLSTLSDLFFNQVKGVEGNIQSMYDIGIRFKDEGGLEVDTLTLSEQINSNFDGLKELMTRLTDVARKDLNAAATSTSTGSSKTKVENLINGNTSSTNFGLANGYESAESMDDGPVSVTINYGEAKTLNNLVLHHVDSTDMPAEKYALKSFIVEYMNDKGEWETLRDVANNNSTQTYLNFDEPTKVRAVRITGTASHAADNKFRLTEVEAFETQGAAGLMNRTAENLTDSTNGWFAMISESLTGRIGDIDDNIESMEERMEMIEINYIRQFTAMETALAQLTTQGDFFTQQMDALNKDK